ncbi:COG4705 family protein [Dictyobacter aurantiacus]
MAAQPVHKAVHLLKKVPEITIFFWIIKLLTTAMGETTSDYMVNHIDPVIAVAIGAFGLCIALVLQLVVRRYIPAVYWFAVVMVAIFGTMAADVLHIGLGIPYLTSTIFFAVALAVIFGAWYATEKTLAIHSIYTLRRELFYWMTIITTFALGTALGDMTATTLHLGYLTSGLLFIVLFALPGLACWLLGLNEILAFWFAYIMTRPLGASFADWMGKPRDAGGIGFGTGTISLVLTVLIIALVAYMTITHKDIDRKQV